jgi:hypothetical protein
LKAVCLYLRSEIQSDIVELMSWGEDKVTSKPVGVTGVTVSGRKPVRVTAITVAVSSGQSDSRDTSESSTLPTSNGASKGAENDISSGWSRPLDKPVELPRGTLKTLAEAGAYILDLPDDIRQRDHWQRATDLLLKAAKRVARVEDVTAQIEHALRMELTFVLSGQTSSVWE